MNILVTFELGDIVIYSVDLMRLLKFRGHTISLYCTGKSHLADPNNEVGSTVTVLDHLPDVSSFDVWMYDATTWETPQTPFLDKMETFKGKLICMNYEDGYNFFIKHLNNYIIDKTLVYINNTLCKDRDKYDSRIRNKVILASSYIGNSQYFKNLIVPFRDKLRRAIFTGNITGMCETGNKEEFKCRVNIPMALINANIPCYYRIYSCDPHYKHILEAVPSEYKSYHLDWGKFLEETVNSMIVLSLRGNGHTVRRYFEGLASGGLVLSTKYNHMVEFIGQGHAGEHFIEIDWSGSDVVEKAKYYLDHLDEAEKIAVKGRKLWENYCMLDENKQLPDIVRKNILNDIKRISNIEF